MHTIILIYDYRYIVDDIRRFFSIHVDKVPTSMQSVILNNWFIPNEILCTYMSFFLLVPGPPLVSTWSKRVLVPGSFVFGVPVGKTFFRMMSLGVASVLLMCFDMSQQRKHIFDIRRGKQAEADGKFVFWYGYPVIDPTHVWRRHLYPKHWRIWQKLAEGSSLVSS